MGYLGVLTGDIVHLGYLGEMFRYFEGYMTRFWSVAIKHYSGRGEGVVYIKGGLAWAKPNRLAWPSNLHCGSGAPH